MRSDLDALDRYITSSRYSSTPVRAECGHCGEDFAVTEESEYGRSEYTPDECPNCHATIDEYTSLTPDEGPDPFDPYDDDPREEW